MLPQAIEASTFVFGEVASVRDAELEESWTEGDLV
jgi:hypothetical protein